MMPALLTNASSRPNAVRHASTMAWTERSSATSLPTTMVLAPAASHSAAAARAASSLRL